MSDEVSVFSLLLNMKWDCKILGDLKKFLVVFAGGSECDGNLSQYAMSGTERLSPDASIHQESR